MAFTPRLTRPEKGNKYYIRKVSGGYSPAIKGKPTDPDCDVLSNCFTGDTRIVTRNGVVSLSEIAGVTVDVLCVDGVYRPAHCSYHGKQPICLLKLGNGSSYKTTFDHNWFVRCKKHDGSYDYKFVFTKNLTRKLHHIPLATNVQTKYVPIDAIRHGFIYGDGTYYNLHKASQALLCGDKRKYMKPYFEDAKFIRSDERDVMYCGPYPIEYKSIPEIKNTSLEYLKGFIIGLLAADGCVDKYGCVSISTTRKHDAQKIYSICSVLGFRCHLVSETRDTNYMLNSTLYRIIIRKTSLTPDMFINPNHKGRFSELSKPIDFTGKKELIDLLCEADVFCMEEPVTHTFTLADGVVTGNCVGYADGRFHEIANRPQMDLFDPIDADLIYDNAIQHGLKASQKPALGALMCWRDKNGGGHVAIVEEIIDENTVNSSNSGWNSDAFYMSVRKKGKGNWHTNPDRIFLGFILQPNTPDPGPTPFTPYIVKLESGTPIFKIDGAIVTQVSFITQSTGYTIVDECVTNYLKYGKLKSGAGWVLLTDLRGLERGDKGDEVKWLQWRLIKEGYLPSGQIDGDFGKKTMSALLGYQWDHELELTAILDNETLKEFMK